MEIEVEILKAERATRQSWHNLKPLPAQRSQLSLQRAFTEQEYERIHVGFIPERMEDKWFIFTEDDTLYIHRSWTGYCIYQLTLIKQDTSYILSEALVNRDESQYSGGDDPYDAKLLMFLIDHLLLNKSGPLPLPANLHAGIVTELHHHHLLGAGQRAEAEAGPIRLTIRGMPGWLWRWLIWLIKR
jgi:hypothetical protein